MTNVLRIVNGVFTSAIRSVYPGCTELNATVQHSGSKFGDYKCMAAMPIAQVRNPNVLKGTPHMVLIFKMLQSKGCAKPPRDIAQEIISKLEFTESFIDQVRMC